jgi:prepilin-type N-terminal cleavage/methylation domain-containing protein
MLRIRKPQGFTLIELLVVVVIIGILAAIALPNFIGAQKKAKVAQVKSNMHTCQLAAESYATDTAGNYGSTAATLAPYYPGGANSPGGAAGNYPQNPFTGSPTAPAAGPGISNIPAERAKAAGAQSGNSGDTAYDSGAGPSSYAVIGYDDAGKSVAGNAGKQLVLSNQ